MVARLADEAQQHKRFHARIGPRSSRFCRPAARERVPVALKKSCPGRRSHSESQEHAESWERAAAGLLQRAAAAGHTMQAAQAVTPCQTAAAAAAGLRRSSSGGGGGRGAAAPAGARAPACAAHNCAAAGTAAAALPGVLRWQLLSTPIRAAHAPARMAQLTCPPCNTHTWYTRMPPPWQEQPAPLEQQQLEAADDAVQAAASSSSKEAAAELLAAQIAAEVARRRNFAIISHPDAGKTTMVRASSACKQCSIQQQNATLHQR